jgi:hypothetical protein
VLKVRGGVRGTEHAVSWNRACAASNAADTVSSAIANRTLTLFGAENVRSKAATFVRPCSGFSRSPVWDRNRPSPA